MTEEQWLAATNPLPMLEFLAGKASARKLRLFAFGCLRSRWQLLRDPRGRQLLDLAECYADGKASAAAVIREVYRIGFGTGIFWILRSDAAEAAHRWAGTSKTRARPTAACLLRDLFRNPFRPLPAFEPAWLTRNGGTVSTLAAAIYDSGDFAHTPLLADALEDAGCTDVELSGHLRRPGSHVRGCWGLDLVLGRT
jgi:hypothetical protein